MADFAVRVLPVQNVRDHPDADRLSIMDVLGFVTISAKLEDGSHRYQDGDLVVYVGESSLVPDYLLKPGFWKEDPTGETEGKGMLAGSKGNRVKAMRLRGVFSQGIMFALADGCVVNEAGDILNVSEGDDVAEFLGITKYEPPVPVGMAGEVCAIFGHTANYDFESIQTVPDLFEDGETVVATEKLHGCLHRDSLVTLPNGEERPIHEVILDLSITHVLSFDETHQRFVSRSITGRRVRPNIESKPWVRITLENGRELVLTNDHPVYSRDKKSWVVAGKIEVNEDIESPIC